MPSRQCTVPDCPKPLRSSRAQLCKMHYHRQYRHGSVDKNATQGGITVSLGRRYLTVYLPNHPLAWKSGKVYAHRVALYEAIGPGAHACHWCAKTVTWDSTRGDDDCLVVDHLNNLGDDNRTENLVPACVGCNNTRGAQARSQALREAGWWSSNDTIAALKQGGRRPPLVTTHVA